MRLPIFAGLAVLAAANEQFDDDDLNFLRMLSSNASSNSSGGAASTAAPMMNQTTTMAVTTTAMTNDTTTTAPATTTAMDDKNATTTMAVTTTAGGGDGQKTNPPQEETTVPVSADELCVATSYKSAGILEANPMTKTPTLHLTSKCEGAEVEDFYEWGDRAVTTTNEAICSTGTIKKTTCADALMHYNSGSTELRQGLVQLCCGKSPDFKPNREMDNVKTGGSLTMSFFSDSACSTAADASTFTGGMKSFFTQASTTLAMDTCVDAKHWKGGQYILVPGCNTTHYLQERYIDSVCSKYLEAFLEPLSDSPAEGTAECASSGRLRQLSNHSSGALYGKTECTASTPEALEFQSSSTSEFTFTVAPSDAQKVTARTTFQSTFQTKIEEAVNDESATFTYSFTYTGVFQESRRRLAVRQLQSALTGSMTGIANIKATPSKAIAAQAKIVTAQASGVLSPTTFAASLDTAIKQADATFPNATIAVTVAVSKAQPVTNVDVGAATSAPSTSDAITNVLSVGSVMAGVFALL